MRISIQYVSKVFAVTRATTMHPMIHRAGQLIDHPIFNALWFNAVWLVLVVGRDAMLLAAVLLLALHAGLARHKRYEYCTLLVLAGIGITVDSVLSLLGVFVFEGHVVMPWWLACLWFAFATTLSRSLGFLARHPVVSVVCGAVSGPASYWAGHQFAAVDFGYALIPTLAGLSVLWAILLPVLLRVSRYSHSYMRRSLAGSMA